MLQNAKGATQRLAINWPGTTSARLGYSWTNGDGGTQVVSGIGLKSPNRNKAWAAGDLIACSACNAKAAPHGDRGMRFELYGRYMSTSCTFDDTQQRKSGSKTRQGQGNSNPIGSPYASLDGGHLDLKDVAGMVNYTVEYWFRVDDSNAVDPVFTWMDIGGQR